MNPESRLTTRNLRIFQGVSYGLVFLMMACVVMTIASLIHNAVPTWSSSVISGILLLIVVDRLLMHARVKDLTSLTSDWAFTVGTQWVVIMVLIRFLLSYAHGANAFASDLSLLSRGYLLELFTPEFFITILLALLMWYMAGQFLSLLDVIGLDSVLALAWREDTSRSEKENIPVHQRLVNLIFGLGIVLVIITALTRLDLRAMLVNPTGLSGVQLLRFSGAEAGALLYFLFGLALISLSRLLSLQTNWQQQRIPVSSRDLQRRWSVYSFYFILLLAVIVSLLPAGDSIGFFAVLGTLFMFLLGVIFFIVQLLLLLVSILISLPYLLLGKVPPFANRFAAPPALPPPPIDAGAPITSSAIWELVRSILLWGSLAIIITFSIIQFIRQHEGIMARLRQSRIAQLLKLAWQWLTGSVDTLRGNLARAIVDTWQNILSRFEGQRLTPQPNWLNLRQLDPRRQIYFFYLALIRRAHEQGLDRKPAQSPAEYATTLESTLPTAQEDIHSLTDGFMEARYSNHPITANESNIVKSAWGHIRRALQTQRKQTRRKL